MSDHTNKSASGKSAASEPASTAANTQTINTPTTLTEFNQASDVEALARVLHWCFAPDWATAVIESRPFASLAELASTTDTLWSNASEDDLLTAFAAHPAIGDVELLRSRYAAHANAEQGQVLAASDTTLAELASQNISYRKRHNFTFIVCATGKSAAEMLALLNARLNNRTEQELANAAAEQGKILQLRLQQTIQNPINQPHETKQ